MLFRLSWYHHMKILSDHRLLLWEQYHTHTEHCINPALYNSCMNRVYIPWTSCRNAIKLWQIWSNTLFFFFFYFSTILLTHLMLNFGRDCDRRCACWTAAKDQWSACTKLFLGPTSVAEEEEEISISTSTFRATVHPDSALWDTWVLAGLAFFSNLPRNMQGWTSISYPFQTPVPQTN